MTVKNIMPITKHPTNGKTIVWCVYRVGGNGGGKGCLSMVDDLETTDINNIIEYSLADLNVTPKFQAQIRMWLWQNFYFYAKPQSKLIEFFKSTLPSWLWQNLYFYTRSPDKLVEFCKSTLPSWKHDHNTKNIEEPSKQYYAHLIKLCELIVSTNGAYKITF